MANPTAQCTGQQIVSEKPEDAPDRQISHSTDTDEEIALRAPENADNWPRGLRPYVVLIGCFFLMFNSWGLVNAYGTFQSYYDQHLLHGTSILLLNFIGSSECFVVLLFSFMMGRLLDAGYTRYILFVGASLITLGKFLLSVISHGKGGVPGRGSYGLTYLTQGFVVSCGMACFFIASSQIAATWFPKRKTVVVGIVACGASFAGLVYPVLVKELIKKFGFSKAVKFAAVLAALTSFLSFAIAVPKRAPVVKLGPWLCLDTWFDPHALRNKAFCWFMAAVALMFFGFYAIFFNLEEWAAVNGFGFKDAVPNAFKDVRPPPHTAELRKDAIRTFYLLAIMNICSSIGRLAGGIWGQWHGTLLVHGVVMFVASVLCLVFWPLVASVKGAIAFVVVFGMFSGAVIGLPPASVFSIAELDKMADKSRLGQWTGMMYTGSAVFALTGPVIAGAIIRYAGGYLGLHLWSGFCLLASSLCIFVSHLYAKHGSLAPLREKYERNASRVRVALSRTASVEKAPVESQSSTRGGRTSGDDNPR